MAQVATFDVTAGAASYTAISGFDNSLIIAASGPGTSLIESAGTIALTANAISAGWAGGGGTTVAGPTSSITAGLTIALGDGTNTLNLRDTAAANTMGGTALITPTANDTIIISGNAPSLTNVLTNIRNDVIITPSGGATPTVAIGAITNNLTPTIAASTVTGMLGATQDKTLTYSSLASLTVKYGPRSVCTVNSTSCPLTIGATSGATTHQIAGCSNSVTIAGTNGIDTVLVGTTAGSLAGLDAILGTVTANCFGGANSLRVDDSGSATGNKTYLITPGASQAATSTIASSSFSTISYSANGGTFATLLQIDGSNIGGCTFTIAANFLDNAIINGNGGNTNLFDFSALTGGTDHPNGDGTGTFTQSNGVTITYSGRATASPPVADFTATPLSGTVSLAVHFTDESTNSPTSWAWTATGQNTSTVYTSAIQNPLITFAVADAYDVELQATNAAGIGTNTKIGYITALALNRYKVPMNWTDMQPVAWNWTNVSAIA